MSRPLAPMILAAGVVLAAPAWGQATTRTCEPEELVGPACLLSHKELPSLPRGALYWHIDQFDTKEAADKAASPASATVGAFSQIWLFTIEVRGWRPKGGRHVTDIGPLPVRPASTYAAEYLRSIFTPGMSAPLHVHSGPEAFYAISGDTCLETPQGIKTGRGPGNSLMIEAGPPMLLMAIGTLPRRGFALILHDASQPPTTLTQAWRPKGLCAEQLSADQRSKPAGR